MTNIPTWSSTDASNNSAAPAGAPEGMQAGKLNDTIRAVQGAIKRMFDDQRGSLTTAGTSNAYTITTNNTFTAMSQIPVMLIELDRANTGAATLNIDGIGAKSLYKAQFDDYASGELKAGNVLLVLPNVSGDCFESVPLNNATLPKGHIHGLELSNDTDASHDISIAAGQAVDDDGLDMMVLSSALVKQIDSGWAVGSAAGGMDTGAVAASTTYHVHLIKRSDTGVVDALFSTSPSAPTMPTNYDRSRRIGSVVTDSSANIIKFKQFGDTFKWRSTTPGQDYNSSGSRSYSLLTIEVPTGINAEPILEVYLDPTVGLDSVDLGDGDDTGEDLSMTLEAHLDAVATRFLVPGGLHTDTSARIHMAHSSVSQVIIWTRGWKDTRGRDG